MGTISCHFMTVFNLKFIEEVIIMRTVRISEEVWKEIAKLGAFGETVDDVLRRVFNIKSNRTIQDKTIPKTRDKSRIRTRKAKYRLSSIFEDDNLILEFSNGVSEKFPLPEKWDKDEISNVTYNVMQFIKENGGTQGQINAGRKALTDAGYHIHGPVSR